MRMHDSGVYCLLLRLKKRRTISVARRELQFEAGYYFYVGSAMRGLDARIGRHLSPSKKRHWHIDSLTNSASVHRVFRFRTRSRSTECRVSRLVAAGGGVPMAGFGSSDCRCLSHLIYYSGEVRTLPRFMKKMEFEKADIHGNQT